MYNSYEYYSYVIRDKRFWKVYDDMAKIVSKVMEYKPTLGRKILDVALDLFSYVQNANRNTDPKRREYYKVKFLTDFEVVKTYIRLEHDLKLINDKKYAYYIRIMDSIGKQMTAWKNREK